MGTLKFTDIELKQLVRKGLSLRAMARHLGVSKSTVCVRLKALNIAVSRDVAIRSARKIVDREINAIDQLQKINRDANELLDFCMQRHRNNGAGNGFRDTGNVSKTNLRSGAGQSWSGVSPGCTRGLQPADSEQSEAGYKSRAPRELALKVMAEIRGQLKLQLEIFQALYDIRAVEEFQAEVLEMMEDVSPGARDEIVRRLAKKNALRSSLDLDQQPRIRSEAGSGKREAGTRRRGEAERGPGKKINRMVFFLTCPALNSLYYCRLWQTLISPRTRSAQESRAIPA